MKFRLLRFYLPFLLVFFINSGCVLDAKPLYFGIAFVNDSEVERQVSVTGDSGKEITLSVPPQTKVALISEDEGMPAFNVQVITDEFGSTQSQVRSRFFKIGFADRNRLTDPSFSQSYLNRMGYLNSTYVKVVIDKAFFSSLVKVRSLN